MTDDGCTENTKFSQPPIQQDKAGIHTYIYLHHKIKNQYPGRKKELEKKSGEKTKKNLKIRLKGGEKKERRRY